MAHSVHNYASSQFTGIMIVGNKWQSYSGKGSKNISLINLSFLEIYFYNVLFNMICVRYQSRLEFPPSPDPLSHAFGRRRRPPRFQRERRRMFLLRACLCELGLGPPAVRFPARGPLRWGNGGRRPNRPTDRPTHPGRARRGEGEKNGSPLLHPFSIPPPPQPASKCAMYAPSPPSPPHLFLSLCH